MRVAAVAPQVEGEIQRALGPIQRFFLPHEGRLHQDEDTQIDIVFAQTASRRGELVAGHSFIQLFEDFGWTVSRPIATSSRPVN